MRRVEKLKDRQIEAFELGRRARKFLISIAGRGGQIAPPTLLLAG